MRIDNRNYQLKFRNMKDPTKVIVNYDGQTFDNTHEVVKQEDK